MRLIPVLISLTALLLAACGNKPKPRAPDVATATATRPGPSEAGPGAESPPKPPDRTRGGVDLGAALDSAGEAREAVREAAMKLAKDRAAGVAALVANKGQAKATVVALLGSENLDELIGAMLTLQADNDPTGARAEAQDAVLGLLDHEVGAVRDVAWETAAKVADGAALARLLPTVARDRKLAIVRLLAAWDGEPVRDALWAVIAGGDPELAIEAALAASATGKLPEGATNERLKALAKDEKTQHQRLALVLYRRFAATAAAVGAPSQDGPGKELIDRALASKDEPLVLEGIRATLSFPSAEREPLYEQLAKDPRPAVRAVTAEVLGLHGKGVAGPLLDVLLGDAEGDVRMAAARARTQFGPPEVRVKALVPKLIDAHRGARLAAAVSLARADLVALASKELAKQLEREDSEARNTLLGALATSRERAGVSVVVDAVGHGDKKLVGAAVFALMTASGQDLGGDVGAWRAWLDKTYPPPPPPTPPPTDAKP